MKHSEEKKIKIKKKQQTTLGEKKEKHQSLWDNVKSNISNIQIIGVPKEGGWETENIFGEIIVNISSNGMKTINPRSTNLNKPQAQETWRKLYQNIL